MSASPIVVAEDVGRETAELRVWTVMAIRLHGDDRFPRVQFRGVLRAPAGFDRLVTVGMAVNGPVAIWSWRDGDAELYARYEGTRGPESLPWADPGAAAAAALAAYARSDVLPSAVVHVPALPAGRLHVDVLADGSFLVVGARCRWAESGPESNALAIDHNGRIFRRGCLGDGIEHLQVAPDGAIWAGYSDEGVFGNSGWGLSVDPTPLGRSGIVQWSPDFVKTWDFDSGEVFVADCYALNVGHDEILACPYDDFPIVRIHDRHVRVIPTSGVSGPDGIIATDGQIGLIGSYDDASLLITGAIQDGTFRESARANLRAPDGTPLPIARVHCRGSIAHFFAGRKWYSFDLQSVA